MEYRYKAEFLHDLASHLEFSHSYHWARPKSILRTCILILVTLWYISLLKHRYVAVIFLTFAAFYIPAVLRNHKHGDASYRRMLITNAGKPEHNCYYFTEQDLVEENLDNGNKLTYSYDQFLDLVETKNQLILVLPDFLGIAFYKDSITGGTAEEFVAWLLEKCPNIKKKKTKHTTVGKYMDVVFFAAFITGILIALLNFPGYSLWDRVSGRLHNDMSYLEMAQELKPLGISISSDTVDELESYDREYEKENGRDYYRDNPDSSKVLDLLYWEAAGYLDPNTEEWIPSTSGLLWFDLRAIDEETMYQDLLLGIAATNKSLEFQNVQADFSNAHQDSGTGTVTVSFAYQDDSYSFDVGYDNAWMDEEFLLEVMNILAQDELEENLYHAYDGQAVWLFYGTQDQVIKLRQKTGIFFNLNPMDFGS